jgi:hypothetical protein
MITLGMAWNALLLALAILWIVYVAKDFRRLASEARGGHPKLGRMPAVVILSITALLVLWALKSLLDLILDPLLD